MEWQVRNGWWIGTVPGFGHPSAGANRLVKVVNAEDTSVTIHAAEFDGQGRRIKKIVTNAGQYDGTVVCYYDGWKIIETRDGSANLYQQFIHGTQYIDEIVMARIANKGECYVHQDANWNVVALTDMGGNVLERYEYTPYGQFTVHEVTGFGDRDGDGVVDATDKGTPGVTCTGTVTGACRILDLDFDGDYDSTDATLFDALPQGLARHPALLATGLDFPFAHQGLYFDPELGSYQNRHRQYDPKLRRFVQRDPLGLLPPAEKKYSETANVYAYVLNSPLNSVDPGGLEPWDIWDLTEYGHFCGPYNNGEVWSECAVDCLDSACCRHDECYTGAGATPARVALHLMLKWTPFLISLDIPLHVCDMQLCRRMQCCGYYIGDNAQGFREAAYFAFSCSHYQWLWNGSCIYYDVDVCSPNTDPPTGRCRVGCEGCPIAR